jgi:RNA polymerase sigma factor (sigma-70 family)
MEPHGRDLDRLIAACLALDQSACDELYGRIVPRIAQSTLRNMGLRAGDHDDILSELRLRLHDAFRAGKPDDRSNRTISAYIRKAARRQALNLLRKRRRHEAKVEQPHANLDGETDNPVEKVLDARHNPEERAQLEQRLALLIKMNPVDRLIFIRKTLGASTEEIGQELLRKPYDVELQHNAIDLRYHRLLKRLREAS